jgi:hypothetical protein
VGCASARPDPQLDPGTTTRALSQALVAGNADALYALLHPEVREVETPALFRERFAMCKDETHALGQAMTQASAGPVAHARVLLESGEHVELVWNGGAWRIAGGVLDAQSLASPLEAVAQLRTALRRRSLPAILRLLARERRAELEAAIESTLAGSEDPANVEVEENGDNAVVHLPGGGEIQLRREAGKWRLWDVK